MRLTFGILFSVIIIAMAICVRIAKNSGKRMGFAAACLLAALILPMAGNGIIIVSGSKTISLIGCYMYYLGLDLSIGALLFYTFVYCRITGRVKWLWNAAYCLLLADIIQLLMNPFLHHAFAVTEIAVDGFAYYKMIPHLGQQVHRVIDYLILAGIIVVFIIRLVKAPRLQTERYWVILVTLILVTAWETA